MTGLVTRLMRCIRDHLKYKGVGDRCTRSTFNAIKNLASFRHTLATHAEAHRPEQTVGQGWCRFTRHADLCKLLLWCSRLLIWPRVLNATSRVPCFYRSLYIAACAIQRAVHRGSSRDGIQPCKHLTRVVRVGMVSASLQLDRRRARTNLRAHAPAPARAFCRGTHREGHIRYRRAARHASPTNRSTTVR